MDSLYSTEEKQPLNYTPLKLPQSQTFFQKIQFYLKKPLVFIPLVLVVLIIIGTYITVKSNTTRREKIVFDLSPTPTRTPTPTHTATPSPTPSVVPTKLVPTAAPTEKTILQPPSNTPPPQPTNTPEPTARTPNPPKMKITYPTESQEITLSTGQTFCVVDAPDGGDQTELQRKQNINNGSWTNYATISTLCYDPAEGDNTLQLQYKNKYGEESAVYTVHFKFHKS